MKKNLYSKGLCAAFATCAFMASPSMFADADVTSDLLLHYTFDSMSGDVIENQAATGAEYNATSRGGGAFISTENFYDGSGSYKLTSTQSDFLLLPNNLNQKFTNFTISTWVYGDAFTMWSRIFDFGSQAGVNMFLTPNSGSTVRYAIKTTGDSGNEQQINSTSSFPVGKWTHVAVSVDYTTATGKMYIDGALVGQNTAMTLKPSDIGSTIFDEDLGDPVSAGTGHGCFIGKAQYADPALNAFVDDFKVYSRALTDADIMVLAGYPEAFVNAYVWLDLGLDEEVTSDIELPSEVNGIPIVWESSDEEVISLDGKVNTSASKFGVVVKLTGTLTYTADNDETYTLSKVFEANVIPEEEVDPLIANWTFSKNDVYEESGITKIKDLSLNEFVGEFKNGASVRTIGETAQMNVLDLGSNNGYFDMGADFGEALVSLNDYTMGAFVRIDAEWASKIGSNGNFLWSLSNDSLQGTAANGYIIAKMNTLQNCITNTNWSNEQTPPVSEEDDFKKAPTDKWFHFCYVQSGDMGQIWIDGVMVSEGLVTLKPSQIKLAGTKGLLYNWLGRPCYNGDLYLQHTLIYDYKVYNETFGAYEMEEYMQCTETLALLNAAYDENPEFLDPALITETENLDLSGLENVTSDLSLPTAGTAYPNVQISWESNNKYIDADGKVTRPKAYSVQTTLTATLSLGMETQTKSFIATIPAAEGTEFKENLLVHYDFTPESVEGNIVKDKAENHYEAELFNSAKVVTLGNLGDIPALNVLSLGAENGYLDLGEDMGNIMYNLGDYTICAWVYIENENTTLNENGNFLWSFSNSADQAIGQDGYMMASMKRTSNQITATNWSAEFGPSREENFAKGIWMHFAYVQSDTIGRLVIDGYDNFESDTDTVRITPKEALRKEGKAGTQFNWIGRPCFAADTYLANTYVHDFRLYNKAFTTEELEQMFDFDTLFDQLTEAMDAYVVLGVEDVEYDNIKIGVSEGKIIVYGAEDQPVTVYDMTGRSIAKTNGSEVSVSNGMYIVKVGTKCIKVMVK